MSDREGHREDTESGRDAKRAQRGPACANLDLQTRAGCVRHSWPRGPRAGTCTSTRGEEKGWGRRRRRGLTSRHLWPQSSADVAVACVYELSLSPVSSFTRHPPPPSSTNVSCTAAAAADVGEAASTISAAAAAAAAAAAGIVTPLRTATMRDSPRSTSARRFANLACRCRRPKPPSSDHSKQGGG